MSLSLRSLGKTFNRGSADERIALDRISLEVASGSFAGIHKRAVMGVSKS